MLSCFRNRLFLLLLILFLSGTLSTHAQYYNFINYNVKNGLSNDVVKSIGQDELGFIYFGTNSGISVYDGTLFRSLPLPDGGDKESIFRIKNISRADLWFNYIGNRRIFSVTKGTLHIKTLVGKPPPINNVYTDISADTILCTEKGLFKLRTDRLVKLETKLASQDQTMHFLLPINDDQLLIGRKGHPLALVRRGDYEFISEAKEAVSVTDIVAGNNGDIWVGTDSRGLVLLDGNALKRNEWIVKPLPPALAFLETEDIYCLHRNPIDQSLMIGTSKHGVISLHANGTVSRLDRNNGLTSNTVYSIFVDRDKNWWVGTNAGVDKLNNTEFVLLEKKDASGTGTIYRICMDQQKRTWFFGKQHMAYREPDGTMKYLAYPPFIEPIVLDALCVGNKMWLCAPYYIFSLDLGETPRVSTIIPTLDIYRRLVDWGPNTLIAGGYKGLARLQYGKLDVIADTLADIRTIIKDRFHTLWVGTFSNGIYRLDIPERVTDKPVLLQRYVDSTSVYNRFLDFYEDRDGDVLAGTRFEGLYIFNNTKERFSKKAHLSLANGLPNNFVTNLSQSVDGRIWIGTSTGFSSMRKIGDQYIFNSTSQYYSFQNPVLQIEPDDRFVWGATDVGVFRLQLVPEKRYNPEILIREMIFPDTTLHLYTTDTTIDLSSGRNSFSISFCSPFYINEQQTRYYFRLLKNGHGEWTAIEGNNSIHFNSLAPGDYLLEIRPITFNKQASNNIARLHFTIATPFFRSFSFYFLLILLIATLSYLFYRYRIQQIKKLYQVRDNISKNLHDEIGATLSSINIFSDVARKNIGNKDETEGLLDRIYKGSSQAMESMSDIVWYVNPKNDDWNNIIVRMREYALPLLEAKNIDVTFNADEKNLTHKLTMPQRQNLYFIFKEAVNNISKYAEAATVFIELKQQGADIFLTIHDNGTGFDQTKSTQGNGLHNMHERAIALRGQWSIESAPGKGTSIQLEFPIA